MSTIERMPDGNYKIISDGKEIIIQDPTPKKMADGNYKVTRSKKEYIIPAATPEMVEKVEYFLYKECSPFLNKIKDMTDAEFEEFINLAASYDHERGIGPGQIPHRIYEHSQWFKDFETEIWKQIDERLCK